MKNRTDPADPGAKSFIRVLLVGLNERAVSATSPTVTADTGEYKVFVMIGIARGFWNDVV